MGEGGSGVHVGTFPTGASEEVDSIIGGAVDGRASPLWRAVLEWLLLMSFGGVTSMRKVLICDDQPRFISDFEKKHSGHYNITGVLGSDGLLDALKKSKPLPDVVLLDLYFPIDETDPNFSKKRNRAEEELEKLREQIEKTKRAVGAVWSPDGIELLKEIRKNWDASTLPVVIYTQRGLLLLDDMKIRDVEKYNGHWLLKGQLSVETEKIRLNRIMSYDAPTTGRKIFIGHGRKPYWKQVVRYIEEEIGEECIEFDSDPSAGLTIFERLSEMLRQSKFAFLIMSGEDHDSEGYLRARENVVHEVGLFQGHLGPGKAIVLLEDGCREFTNIRGLVQIRFKKGKIEGIFERIHDILKSRKAIEG